MIFDINQIHKNWPITGVMHVGAFVGEELESYRKLDLYNTIMFEPQPNLYNIVKDKCTSNETVYNVALGSKCDTKEMYVSWREGGIRNGCGASSSLMKPKKHLIEHADISFKETIDVKVDMLDNYHKDEYNFLNIDVQGYELEVLKGAINCLPKIDSMILEVNRDEVYEGCPMIQDLDNFLQPFGFKRIATAWQSESWGDAVYARN